jgi:sulfofructose kinase
MRQLLGLGQVVYDILISIPDLPAWEHTSYVEEYQVQQGGMAATALVTAGRLGAKAEFIGGIGNDLQGEFAKDSFLKDDIIFDRMRVFNGEPSSVSIVFVQKATGKRSFAHIKGVQSKSELFGEDINLSGVRFILFDGFYPDTAMRTVRQARARGIVSVADLSPGTRMTNALEYLSLVDYPIVSDLFITSYLKADDILAAAKSLYSKSNKALLVTCGEKGVHVITDQGVDFVPAFEVPVVDTTGAGDVFHGAFLFSLWKGYGLREAVVFSSAVAALKCTKIGGQLGIPDFSRTREFLAQRLPDGAAWV